MYGLWWALPLTPRQPHMVQAQIDARIILMNDGHAFMHLHLIFLGSKSSAHFRQFAFDPALTFTRRSQLQKRQFLVRGTAFTLR
jgi:hypothetical protein